MIESTGASVAAAASRSPAIQYGVESTGTMAATMPIEAQAATAVGITGRQRSRRARIGRSRARYDTTASVSVTVIRRANRGSGGRSGALGVEHDVHRPVVEVHAVADRPEGDERCGAERSTQR